VLACIIQYRYGDRTLIRRQRHHDPRLQERQPLGLHRLHDVPRPLLLLLRPPRRRHVQRKVRPPRVAPPRQHITPLLSFLLPATPPLVQPQEDELRRRPPRVVVADHLLLGPVVEVRRHERLDILVARVRQLGRGPCQRGQLLEQHEARRGVPERRGEEGVLGAEEGEAVQRRVWSGIYIYEHVPDKKVSIGTRDPYWRSS